MEKKSTYQNLKRPRIRKSTGKHLRSADFVADAVSGFLREEAQRDIKIFFPLFIYKALHLRRVQLDITASKLTTTCVRHWSKIKFYNFPIVSEQHCSTCFPRIPQTVRCMRPTVVNQFRVNSFSNNCGLVTKPR